MLKDHFMTCEGDVFDSYYRGVLKAMLINHSNDLFTVNTGDKVAQMVFLKKFNVDFVRVKEPYQLGKTKRGSSGFGSSSFKKVKFEDEEQKNDLDFEKKSRSGRR